MMTILFIIVVLTVSGAMWVLINDILMPTLWDIGTKTLKSVLKALTLELKRKEDKKNNM